MSNKCTTTGRPFTHRESVAPSVVMYATGITGDWGQIPAPAINTTYVPAPALNEAQIRKILREEIAQMDQGDKEEDLWSVTDFILMGLESDNVEYTHYCLREIASRLGVDPVEEKSE
jgi:hypothetical protein